MGMGYPQPQYAAPPKKRGWMIPVAAVLGVALMGTTVWASNSFVGGLFGGPQPESVLPSSTMVFAKLDLKPDGGQLANYAQFMDRLPDSVKDEIDPDADPAEEIVDQMIEGLGLDMSYAQDFEPWLGKRFGVAAWAAENEDAAVDDGMATVIAVAVEDEESASATLGEIEDETQEFTFDFRDDFALLAPNDAVLSELHDQIDSDGSLADEETFASDMETVGTDSIAAAWMDLGKIDQLESESPGPGYDDFGGDGFDYGDYDPSPLSPLQSIGDVTGRIALGVKIESEYAELRGDLFDVSVEGTALSDYATAEPGIDVLGDLPDDTVMAVGGSGLDAMVQQVYEESPDDFADFGDAMAEVGAPLPDGLTDVLGSETAFAITDFQGSFDDFFSGYGPGGSVSFQYRGVGADLGTLQEIVDQMFAGGYGSPPGVAEEGGSVVVSSGATGTGKLGDDSVYQQTMQGMEEASFGFYLDLRPFMEQAGEHGPEQWGSFGGSMSFGEESTSVLARWAPDGGD
ncbi:MAG: hypothetical protein M0026_01030 [Nocardiopsaceae bacterium]|nr:hypothetical protein [Nocardiopsaceae bacterium]